MGSHAQKERFKQGIKESKNLRSDNLAKDGTYRGGRRVRAGDKPKPVAEKIQAGEMVKILANDIPDEYYAELVNKRLIESYSQAFARYIQCEEAISRYGMLGKHPTTGGVIASPFIQMSSQFQKTANLIWYEIYDIVKQNCTEIFEEESNDPMERLLRGGR